MDCYIQLDDWHSALDWQERYHQMRAESKTSFPQPPYKVDLCFIKWVSYYSAVSLRESSGRVLESRPRSHGFQPHQWHCLVSLSKNINPSLVLVWPRKTRPFITERLMTGRKESNQTNKIIDWRLPFIVQRHKNGFTGLGTAPLCLTWK